MSQVDSSNDGSDSKSDKSTPCVALEVEHTAVGKVGIDLIETILGEMKSEFNREVNTIENVRKDKVSRTSKGMTDEECLSVKNESQVSEAGKQKQSEVKLESDPNSNNQSSAVVSAVGNTKEKQYEVVDSAEIPNVSSKNDGLSGKASGDPKPRIVMTLKAEDSSDGNRKIKAKGTQGSESNGEEVWTLVNPELGGDTGGSDTFAAPSTTASGLTSGKRSLRSQMAAAAAAAAAKATVEESAGVKRSARRRSKDSPRESVLQSAIARKEKSFSNLGQGEDKISAARNLKVSLHRSPRLSPTEKNQAAGLTRTSKSPAKASLPPSKSARLSQQNLHNDHISTKSGKSEDIASLTANSVTKSSVAGNKSSHSSTSRAESGVKTTLKSQSQVPSSNAQTYTKTGKRRYRPYKGLRYSFTGNNVRRAKPPRRQIKESNSNSNVAGTEKKSSEPEETNEMMVLPDKQPVTVVQSQQEQLACADPIAKSHAAEFPSADLCGSRSGSPVMAEACQTISQKRKLQPDDDGDGGDDVEVVFAEDGSKRSRLNNVPSPSPADSSQGPAKPESTAISSGAGTAALCCCQTKSQLFVSTRGQNGAAGELYCQAIDTLDDRLVGCCNAVTAQDTRLSRPSHRVPYLILCDVHMQRLFRHNCCPGCGVFCTQGKFVQCASAHWYHRDCQLTVDSASACPHCGLNSPNTDVMLTMRSGKNPVFLPQQKPPKKVPSAKMTFSTSRAGAKTEEMILKEPTPPLVPPAMLTSQFPSTGLDKDKYSMKSLYQAAKSGNAEKLIHILGSGLNPNHLFRECSMGTALHAACSGGHLSVVHILLQAGAHLDVLDRDQNTPLMLAAVSNHNDLVKYLVKAGANVILKGGDGMTALHLAAKAGNIETCQFLLAVANTPRSFIDIVDDGGWTPLVWAAEHCHVDVTRYLLQNRADPLIRDAEQNIALHWSAFSGSVDISDMLLNYGSEVNSTNVHGDTPLHIGARQNMYNCVLLLLARGARVDVINKAGDGPLECCLAVNNDCYIAINLNIQLKAIVANPREQTERILTNDISRGQEQNPIQCVNVEDDEGEPTDFVYVSENCFTSNISVDRTITSLQSCKCLDMCSTVNCHCGNISLQCWYDDQGRLLPDFNYADPPMLFECNQGCSCNRVTCNNRVVQHGLTARFQLFRTKVKGWGVRTLRPISKGTYVCEYIGEIISDCEADHREDDSYLFDLDNRDGETYCIDARHYGNVARFINHMCVPNLLPVRVFIEHQDLHFPRIAFFANRDIEADEELGFDYGEKFWIIKCKSFTCTCGAETCRYSETTIKQTLDNYNKRLLQDELLLQQSELQLL
ncbi:histone-lysine N-methyltransferase EHMT2 isoform X2 [Zootermopsis nevadensis]|uniref:histone-lysine N-methyltransferase EHMT2 isoform X2 n=1 Tax=Zootermopsis nevadensis TaxID=136037 RepID=UPI000B8EB430|nr:histone-lysine N-methyltransferase EHMT2 isoform X2 [Zootermopsis nevadensis]